MADPLTSDQVAFWQERYQSQTTPWDLDQVAPPFKAFWERQGDLSPLKPGQRLAVVGSGNGHDAAYFADEGFNVTGLDYAPLAIQNAQKRYHQVQFREADIFNLPPDLFGTFDVVLEHTCFCAIRPNQREAYVKAVASLLKPQGVLLGLFWDHGEWGGPPYTVTPDKIKSLFGSQFEIVKTEKTPHSTLSRQDQEWLVLMQAKPH